MAEPSRPERKPRAGVTLDALGLLCPLPIIHTAKRMKAMRPGEVLELLSDDRGVEEDLPAWCRSQKQEFLGIWREGDVYHGYVRKLK